MATSPPSRPHRVQPQVRRSARPAPAAPRLILLNKPFGVLSQFSGDGTHQTLSDFVDVPNVYPAGRLDRDSEGLLLLTNDGALQAHIADPRHKLPKTYWAQVEGAPSEEALAQLRAGVLLNDGITRPAEATLLPEPTLWPRDPPIRVRAQIPTHWIALTLREGRNRQVRRMVEALGAKVLKLVRVRIGQIEIAGLEIGTHRVLTGAEVSMLRKPVKPSGAAQHPVSPAKQAPGKVRLRQNEMSRRGAGETRRPGHSD